jgi:hypothetical protein
MWLRRSLLVLIVPFLLLTVGIVGYAAHVRGSAGTLIRAASEIRSTADAKQQITIWQHAPQGYSESRSPDGEGRAYQIRVGNGLLSAFRMVPKTDVSLEVVTRSGELQLVVLGMYTDRSSVWVQEDFARDASGSLSVNTQRDGSGKPIKTVIMFPVGLDEAKKKSAFALTSNCFVKPGGCENADEILPTLRELESAGQAPVTAGAPSLARSLRKGENP